MRAAEKIQQAHVRRRAYIYLRQSTQKQVRENTESAIYQRGMRKRLIDLGWKDSMITTIDCDLGYSGTDAASRSGFQKIVTDVGLNKVGLVMGHDVSRLARSCRDWYQLIDLCSMFDTLIADHDGVYHPAAYNDRLLLGLKGTMSEAELHGLRARMDAGRLSKAQRGELVQNLPTGYTRESDGGVSLDPDKQIQASIRLVFQRFRNLGSIRKVTRYFVDNDLKLPRRQRSGLYAGEVLWKSASEAAVGSLLKNPAYAGAFAYGRRCTDRQRQIPGRPSTGRIRRPKKQWISLVKEKYPAYITWDDYETNQRQIEMNRQSYEDKLRARGVERTGRALLQGLVACRRCGRAMSVRYRSNDGFEYICVAMRRDFGKRPCQYVSGVRIDEAVVEQFLAAVAEVEIDALNRVEAEQSKASRALTEHLEREVARREYECKLAEKQYNNVDPENRLVAASLEARWEEKLELRCQAQERLEEAQRNVGRTASSVLTNEIKRLFLNAGRGLPKLWPDLDNAKRKKLLRALITRVHLNKIDGEGQAEVRIAWRGMAVTDLNVHIRAFTRRGSMVERRILKRMRELVSEGNTDTQIADTLNQEGYVSCRQASSFGAAGVLRFRLRHGLISAVEQARKRGVRGHYTLPEVAKILDVHPSWLYKRIGEGTIRIDKHPIYKCYLFEKKQKPVNQLRALRRGVSQQVSFTRGAQ